MKSKLISARCAIAGAVLGLLAGHGAAVAAIPAAERQVLIDLYNSANGDDRYNMRFREGGYYYAGNFDWKQNGSFRPAGTECSWGGITCNKEGTQIIAIDIRGLAYKYRNFVPARPAYLPSSLGTLRGLEEFRASSAKLGGALPNLRGLQKLRVFDVSNNRFEGNISAAGIAGHPSLEEFNVAFNRLVGTAPNPAPPRLLRGKSDLCPNLMHYNKTAAWNQANHSWTVATFGEIGVGPAFNSWTDGVGLNFYYSHLDPYSASDFGCQTAQPVPLQHANALEKAHLLNYRDIYNNGRDSYLLNLLASGGYGFVDVIRENGVAVETHPKMLTEEESAYSPTYGMADPHERSLKVTEIYFSFPVMHDGDDYVKSLQYRLCAGAGGKEPCSAPATVTFRSSPERIAQRVVRFEPSSSNDLDARLSSGRAPHYTNFTPQVCEIVGTITNRYPSLSDRRIKPLRFGTCTIVASEPGNPIYAPAAPVTRSFLVDPVREVQRITFPAQSVPAFAVGRTFTLTGIKGGYSGNPVTLSVTTGPVCSVKGLVVTMHKPGTCTLAANQAGNERYTPAMPVYRSFRFAATKAELQAGEPELGLPPISTNE